MAPRHGTRRRYNEGCRCKDCTADNTAYQQEYRHRPTAVVLRSTPVTPPSGHLRLMSGRLVISVGR
jgi:hypothetical protein